MFRLFHFLCALLLILVITAWTRSYRYADGVEISNRHGGVLVMATRGGVRVCWPSPTCPKWDEARWRVWGSSTPRAPGEAGWRDVSPASWRQALFDHGILSGPSAASRYVEFGLWPLAILAGLPLLIALSRRASRTIKRRLRGLCRQCGYDLRATRERCPECGESVVGISFRRRSLGWSLRLGLLAGFMICIVLLSRHDFRNLSPRTLDFAVLCAFKFDDEHGKLADIPASVRQLDGQRIAIEGSMIPMDQAENITEFALVPKLFGWHSGAPPRIPETIVARIINDCSVSYCPDRIRISGTLHVDTVYADGYLMAIYWMDVDRVTPAEEPPPTQRK